MALVMQLICQGETLANRKSKFPSDDPLSDISMNQIRQLKEYVGPFSKIWISPGQPARQTASGLGLSGEPVPELAEPGYGRWAGIQVKKVIEQEGGAFQYWLSGGAPPGGESIMQVMARTGTWLSLMVSEQGHQCAIVSSAVIRAIVIQLLDAPASSFHLIDIQPLSMTQLSSNGKRWHLTCLGKKLEEKYR